MSQIVDEGAAGDGAPGDTNEEEENEEEELTSEEDVSSEEDESSEEEEWKRSIERQQKRRKTTQNYNPLRRVTLVSARFGVSEAATASICNAFNRDQGVSLEENPELIVSSASLHCKRTRIFKVKKR